MYICMYVPVFYLYRFYLNLIQVFQCNCKFLQSFLSGTFCVRILLFPLVIMTQKNMIKFGNHMPVIAEMQAKMSEARQMGDHFEST